MPLYEYECEACGQRFEVIRKFSDPPLEVCRQCGAGPIRRLPSSPAIQFKGSGFYITDYPKTSDPGRADKQSSEQKEDAKSDAATDKASKTEGKAEGKAAGKTEGSSGTPAKPDAPAKSNAAAKPSTPSATTSSRKKD